MSTSSERGSEELPLSPFEKDIEIYEVGTSESFAGGDPPRFTELRWNALHAQYEDRYSDLLRDVSSHDVLSINLQKSQIGAVTWYPNEKAALYQAISRRGKRDLPVLVEAVGSKSQVEIRDYLLFLREKEAERHLCLRQTNSISHIDIPAAIEVSPELEETLEQAADAQLAYEEHYEHVTYTKKNDGPWVINCEVAEKLDADYDAAEADFFAVQGEETDLTSETPIFRVSKYVELSERLFMNSGDESGHENWRQLAMEGETPAITKDVVSELEELAINLTRKLVQTSLFLAQSRQRATTNNHYRHRAIVREQDVAAAVSILKLKYDLWDFWTGVPRRNKLDIVEERKSRGNGQRKKMSYEAVEQILSKRMARWRGRRHSRSAGTGTSMTEDEAFDTADNMYTANAADSDSDSVADHSSSSSSYDGPNVPEAHPLDAILDADASNESEAPTVSTSNSNDTSDSHEFGCLSFHAATPRQKRRQMYLEAQQDEYLEQLDAEASRAEEMRLLELLGREVPVFDQPEDEKDIALRKRPKVLRKSVDDLEDPLEVHQYGAEWELFGEIIPNDSFEETGRQRKRPRMAAKRAATRSAGSDHGKRRDLPIRDRVASEDTLQPQSATDSE